MNLATSCNLVHVLISYNFLFRLFRNLCSASAIQFPMDLCSASAIQPISLSLFLLLYVKTFNSGSFHGTNRQILLMTSSTMFKSKTFKLKLQISSSRFPLLLFTLRHTPTHKLHYRSTSLSGYSAKFQCCKSR